MNSTISKLTLFAFLAGASIMITGCASKNAYIDPKGTDTIVSLNKINIQDWDKAASDMVNSLLTSNVFAGKADPVVLGISRISNDTTAHLDTGRLTKKIRIALNKSGKCRTMMTTGLGGKAEDPMAAASKEYNDFVSGKEGGKALMPQYTLSGKILEDNARAGRVRQVTYTFQLSLTEVNTGLAAWEDERSITKQGKRASVGW